MAPEIVRREASPSTATDLYSLAVLLFYLLMVGHPLVGRRELEFTTWDDRAESVLFGRDPSFIFDPDDDRNAPLPDLHGSVITNWQLYPGEVRKLFVQAFTKGLSNPRNGRVRESVWRSTLSRVRDLIMRCPACGRENFWKSSGNEAVDACWSCDRALPNPVRLNLDGRLLVLNEGTTLASHHLRLDYNFETVLGRIIAHPTQPGRWGLRNESAADWDVTLPSGEKMIVEPARSVGLRAGTVISIDRNRVLIEA